MSLEDLTIDELEALERRIAPGLLRGGDPAQGADSETKESPEGSANPEGSGKPVISADK